MEELFAEKKCDVLLTPHYKELSRLTGDCVGTVAEKGLDAPGGVRESAQSDGAVEGRLDDRDGRREDRREYRGDAGTGEGRQR